MPRTQISIKLEPENLSRVDEVAQILGMSRTTFIERACLRALADQESILEEMESESALTAAVLDSVLNSRQLRKAVNKLVLSSIPAEELEKRVQHLGKMRGEANRRKASRKERAQGGAE